MGTCEQWVRQLLTSYLAAVLTMPRDKGCEKQIAGPNTHLSCDGDRAQQVSRDAVLFL